MEVSNPGTSENVSELQSATCLCGVGQKANNHYGGRIPSEFHVFLVGLVMSAVKTDLSTEPRVSQKNFKEDVNSCPCQGGGDVVLTSCFGLDIGPLPFQIYSISLYRTIVSGL